MRLSPPAQLSVRARRQPAQGELLLRYAASFACTLIAVAASALIIPSQLALVLAAITLLGLPISLYWRWSNLQLLGLRIPRFLINSFIVISTSAACLYLLLTMQPELFTRGLYYTLMLSPNAGNSITILMNMFLIFAAVRSLGIINDKDAVLSAVPSFSVLLLLIVIDRGPAVVVYFILWSLAAAILFALDHRQESRQGLSGIIPSLESGQDIRLSARGLATTMGFSLFCAICISYYVSSRDPEERGAVESWILGVVGRVTQFALNMPEVSINSGPERQIDFSSGPALPTRAELWSVAAIDYQWQQVRPEYWRMFTLSNYNGATWSQTSGAGTPIASELLSEKQWPLLQQPDQAPTFSPNRRRPENPSRPDNRRNENRSAQNRSANNRSANNRSADNRPRRGSGSTPAAAPTGGNAAKGRTQNNAAAPSTTRRFSRARPGYSIATRHPSGEKILASFGASPQLIIQLVEPLVASSGFAPMLPAPRAVRIRSEKPPPTIRVRQDGGVDIGVLQPTQVLVVLSEVSPGESYGVRQNGSAKKPASRAYLSPAERSQNLQLPPRLLAPDSRVKKLGQEVLSRASSDESNYQRARRLSLMLQQRAAYTLRPPAIPARADAAEYFLFESRRGYCTYFAGALTVLCRSAGIPARVVSGFVNPEWSENGQSGILREANAHAWTEVWVEGWGWASIDATPPENRGNNAPSWWENWTDFFATTLSNIQLRLQDNLVFAACLTLLFGIASLFWLLRRGIADPLLARLQQASRGRVRLTRDQSRRLISKAYYRAAKKLARRFRRRVEWETPNEWLASAEATLNLENPRPLRELTRLFLQAEYSPRAISDEEGVAAYQALKNLSWKTRRA